MVSDLIIEDKMILKSAYKIILLSLFVAIIAGIGDINWHVSVGRDTRYELPHLLLYT